MISVEYVPSLTSAEEESHRQFHEAVGQALRSGPDVLDDVEWALTGFAASIWAAAFKRAEEVLTQKPGLQGDRHDDV